MRSTDHLKAAKRSFMLGRAPSPSRAAEGAPSATNFGASSADKSLGGRDAVPHRSAVDQQPCAANRHPSSANPNQTMPMTSATATRPAADEANGSHWMHATVSSIAADASAAQSLLHPHHGHGPAAVAADGAQAGADQGDLLARVRATRRVVGALTAALTASFGTALFSDLFTTDGGRQDHNEDQRGDGGLAPQASAAAPTSPLQTVVAQRLALLSDRELAARGQDEGLGIAADPRITADALLRRYRVEAEARDAIAAERGRAATAEASVQRLVLAARGSSAALAAAPHPFPSTAPRGARPHHVAAGGRLVHDALRCVQAQVMLSYIVQAAEAYGNADRSSSSLPTRFSSQSAGGPTHSSGGQSGHSAISGSGLYNGRVASPAGMEESVLDPTRPAPAASTAAQRPPSEAASKATTNSSGASRRSAGRKQTSFVEAAQPAEATSRRVASPLRAADPQPTAAKTPSQSQAPPVVVSSAMRPQDSVLSDGPPRSHSSHSRRGSPDASHRSVRSSKSSHHSAHSSRHHSTHRSASPPSAGREQPSAAGTDPSATTLVDTTIRDRDDEGEDEGPPVPVRRGGWGKASVGGSSTSTSSSSTSSSSSGDTRDAAPASGRKRFFAGLFSCLSAKDATVD